MAAALDYVAMPDAVVKQVEATWAGSVMGDDGKPVYMAH